MRRSDMKRVTLCGLATILLAGATLLTVSGCGGPTPEQLRTKAISEYQVGKLEEARDLFRQVLWTEPADADSLFYLGRICYSQGEYAKAMYYYQSCLDVQPSNEAARRGLAEAKQAAGPDIAEFNLTQ